MEKELTCAIILNFKSSFETIKLYQILIDNYRESFLAIVVDNASEDKTELIFEKRMNISSNKN